MPKYPTESELLNRLEHVFDTSLHLMSHHDILRADCDRLVFATPGYHRLPMYKRYSLRQLYYYMENQHLAHTMPIKIGMDGRIFYPGDDSWLSESHEYKTTFKHGRVYKADKSKVYWDAIPV